MTSREAAEQPNLPGLNDALRRDLEERLQEFEAEYQQEVMRGGPGWVPRIRRVDYAIAIAVNAVIVLWLLIVLLGGE